MHIKTTMRYHLIPVRMAIINKSTNSKCWQGRRERGTPLHCWWECRLVKPLWKAAWRYLKKSKMDLPFGPAIPLLGTYPKEPKTLLWKNISMLMFIAVLFTITKIGSNLCPSIYEWIKQLWDIYKMEHYLAIKKEDNFTLCHSMDGYGEHYAKWNKPVRQRQIPRDFTHMCNLMNKLN